MKLLFALVSFTFATGLAAYGATTGSAAPSGEPAVLGFDEWKNAKVEEARLALERLSFEKSVAAIAVAGASKSREAKERPGKVDQRIDQAKLNLEIARDLAVEDYLKIYVSSLHDREALASVAKKLSADDVTELLMAYQQRQQAALSERPTSSPLATPATVLGSPRPSRTVE